MTAKAIEARGLGKDFLLGERRGYGTLRDTVTSRLHRRSSTDLTPGVHTALEAIDFSVLEGETVGFVGHNGAGKSTLLKILSRITPPTRGTATLRGRVGALLEVGTGFHPELTGRENVFLNGAILGMTRGEIRARFDQIVAFAGIGTYLDTPVKHYSSGMTVRLAFAVAAHIDPEILLVDEVLAVGDASFQRRCLDRLAELAEEGRTVLFVSHNMAVIRGLCPRGILLEQGRIVDDGPMGDVVTTYLESLERASAQPLSERTDRQGSGPVRIVEVLVEGPDGTPPVSGGPMRIDVRVAPVVPFATCALTIHDSFGLPVTSLDSSNRAEADLTDEGDRFVCDIPELLLQPGRFRIDIGIQVGKVWHDAVHAAVTFDVEQGRAGGRAALAEQEGAAVLPHRWTSPAGP